jgi:UDP-sugar pyrophosphorylase
LQDTNALVFRALLAALGLSAANDYDMNSLAVPRKAKEAIGAITRLTKADGSGAMTVNVEYNQLDPLLRSTINKDGDVNDESGECIAGGSLTARAGDRQTAGVG